jgi:hypothetical protein
MPGGARESRVYIGRDGIFAIFCRGCSDAAGE